MDCLPFISVSADVSTRSYLPVYAVQTVYSAKDFVSTRQIYDEFRRRRPRGPLEFDDVFQLDLARSVGDLEPYIEKEFMSRDKSHSDILTVRSTVTHIQRPLELNDHTSLLELPRIRVLSRIYVAL